MCKTERLAEVDALQSSSLALLLLATICWPKQTRSCIVLFLWPRPQTCCRVCACERFGVLSLAGVSSPEGQANASSSDVALIRGVCLSNACDANAFCGQTPGL